MTAIAHGSWAIGRQELAGLLGEVKQDRVAVENEHAVIVDRRHLAVRIDGEKFRLELISLAGVDRHQFIGQAGLFQKQRDLVGVRRAVEVKFQHWELPCFCCRQKSECRGAAAGSMSMLKFRQQAQGTSSRARYAASSLHYAAPPLQGAAGAP